MAYLPNKAEVPVDSHIGTKPRNWANGLKPGVRECHHVVLRAHPVVAVQAS